MLQQLWMVQIVAEEDAYETVDFMLGVYSSVDTAQAAVSAIIPSVTWKTGSPDTTFLGEGCEDCTFHLGNQTLTLYYAYIFPITVDRNIEQRATA